jgi:translation initiation factor IF-1
MELAYQRLTAIMLARAERESLSFKALLDIERILNDNRRSRMSEQSIELEGTVRTVLPGTMFRVVLDNQHEVLAHVAGKMRKHFVRLTAGDRVRLEMSPYDLTKARITYRLQ